MNLKYEIKKLISNNPKIYYVWKCLFRKEPYAISTEKTLFCLKAYPRSENTFALNLIRGTLVNHYPKFFVMHSEHLVSHHTHKVANVRRDINKGVPVFIIIRNPMEAISSSILKRENKAANKICHRKILERIKEYKNFYSKTMNKDVKTFDFKTIINSPSFL